MPSVNEISSNAAAIAQQLGIQKYDIYGSSVDETSVQVDFGEPKQVKASNRSSVIVRVWNENNSLGVTSTTDVDAKGLELALKTAYEASHFGAKENVPDFSPEATVPIEEVNEHFPQAPVDRLIETLVQAEKQLLEAHPAIAGVPYNGLSQRDISKFYVNSEGAVRREAGSYASIYLYSKTEQEGKKPRSGGAYRMNHSLDQLDIDGCFKEAADKTISHLNYNKVKSGKYRVVFSPEAFLSLLGAFSNLFNAQSILDKQSLSTPESLGTQIASPLLSVCDDPLHPGNIAQERFDGEGTPTRQVPLITKGVLTSFLHSSGTAKRMNAQPTGNANIGAKVTVSPHFYHVSAGEPGEQHLSLETAENVIWIDDLHALHAGVNALQGSFSLPFDGWLVNKGDRVSIDSATIAGDFLSLLKSIVYVEAEEEVTPGGISPKIWVDDMSVTGE
ncbi:TldD/PmbA family protein [Oscillatoria sp. FACHB-1407]|uniref:TldD/PmbA family protein n=1 Tax=Oscillatoria sp. FACHB-1407 TaxID=2692847 RepID=UPI001687D0A1|nr:TldD/PmbA family protein [Oscillatoria sp. FACHB-1407]MBD2464299.1 TldD/PmbA family protein [Oscillatoria sp. FACHB-1407]